MLNKILIELKDFEKEVIKYEKNIKKFKKKFPKADVYAHLSCKLSSAIFVNKYGNSIEFFKPERIYSQNGQVNPLIELEKWSVNSWSSSGLTKITIKDFINNYMEINEDYVKTEINKYKLKEMESIKKLENETLKKLKSAGVGK
jgi:hypothetical protein